jgi:hypothetical protein
MALVMVLAATSARAQGGVLLQGVFDVEGWKTDTMSTLLMRNGGDPAGLYRLHLWGAVEPTRGLFVFANAKAEGGNARRFDGPGTTVQLQQGGVRYARHRAAVIDVGRMAHPIGGFGTRELSTRNPLIGIPDGYPPVYPLGAMLSGEKGRFDYRGGAITLPPTHRDYVPYAEAAIRPVAGVGVTLKQGLRVGVSATDGSYLNDELTSSQLNGRGWRTYRQRVLASDAQYGFAHVDFKADYAVANFEVPYSGWIAGQAGYAEARATVTPRVFVAVRGEFNRYPFISPATPTSWTARPTELRAVEAGGGFRFGANTILKASVSADHWVVTPDNYAFVRPGGRAVALQLSRAFDVAGR